MPSLNICIKVSMDGLDKSRIVSWWQAYVGDNDEVVVGLESLPAKPSGSESKDDTGCRNGKAEGR